DPESVPSESTGILILARESAIAPMPNTKNTSARCSLELCNVGSVLIHQSSPNSVAAETLHPLSAWPTLSSPAVSPILHASIRSPSTTTLNPTGTNGPISQKLKKNAAAPVGT